MMASSRYPVTRTALKSLLFCSGSPSWPSWSRYRFFEMCPTRRGAVLLTPTKEQSIFLEKGSLCL